MLLVLLGAFFISFSAVFVQLAEGVHPTVVGFYRFLFGGMALSLFALARGLSWWRGWAPFLLSAACGFLFSVDLFFWHRSIRLVGPGVSTLLANMQVFILALVGFSLFKEKLTWRFALALPLAVTGLYLLCGVSWGEKTGEYHWGLILGGLAAVSYSTLTLLLRYSQSRTDRLHPVVSMAVLCLAGAGFSAIDPLASGASFAVPGLMDWGYLAAYGILCSALGWYFITSGLAGMPASLVGLVLLLQPSLSFVWDVLFFSRPTTFVEAAGVVLTLAAIYLGTTRSKNGGRR